MRNSLKNKILVLPFFFIFLSLIISSSGCDENEKSPLSKEYPCLRKYFDFLKRSVVQIEGKYSLGVESKVFTDSLAYYEQTCLIGKKIDLLAEGIDFSYSNGYCNASHYVYKEKEKSMYLCYRISPEEKKIISVTRVDLEAQPPRSYH